VRQEEARVVARVQEPDDASALVLHHVAVADSRPVRIGAVAVHELGRSPFLPAVERAPEPQVNVALVVARVLARLDHRQQRVVARAQDRRDLVAAVALVARAVQVGLVVRREAARAKRWWEARLAAHARDYVSRERAGED